MKAVLVVVLGLLALAVVDASALKKLRAKATRAYTEVDVDAAIEEMLDAEYDIWGGGVKDKLHEKIMEQALAASGKANDYNKAKLEAGVRWPDMPGGNKNDYTSVVYFGIDFKGSDTQTLVWNSHYGCLQQLHAMAPEIPGETYTFTNRDVAKLIKDQMQYMWNKAVENKNDKDSYSFWIGKILHMLGDGTAGGHAMRGWVTSFDTLTPNEKAPAGLANFDKLPVGSLSTSPACGKVLYFQGYGAQKGNAEHGNMDHDPEDVVKGRGRTDKDLRRRGIKCAMSANLVILNAFAACKARGACVFPGSAFSSWFQLSLPDVLAGGSRASMADPNISQTKYVKKSMKYIDLMGAPITTDVWIPKADQAGAKKWAEAKRPICTSSMTARTGLTGAKQPFREFKNSLPTDGA